MTKNPNKVGVKDGEAGWMGVNERVDPRLLPAGVASRAVNMRFVRGEPETRGGCVKLPWGNKLSINGPQQVLPYESVWGAGEFNDPDDFRWMIEAAEGGVYRSREGNVAMSIPLPAETSIDYPVEFLQAFNVLILFRGSMLCPLVMEDVEVGFKVATSGLANFLYGTAYNQAEQVLYPPRPGQVWSETATYAAGDLLLFSVPSTNADNKYYRCSTATTAGQSPATTPGSWTLVQWKASTAYSLGAQVVFQATLVECTANTSAGESPLTRPDAWEPVESKVYAAQTATTAGDTPVSAPTKWGYVRDVMPNADRGLFIQDRVVVPNGRDLGAVSDAFDYVLFIKQLDEFRINEGSADRLVAFAKFNDTTVVCFKEQSVYVVRNFYGDLSQLQQDEFSHSYGLLAPKGFALCGKDLWFLSQRGVVSLTQTTQNQLQGIEIPVSAAMTPVLQRMVKRLQSQAVAAYQNNRFYLAVSLDAGEITRVMTPEIEPEQAVNYFGLKVGRRYRFYSPANSTGSGGYFIECGSFSNIGSCEFTAQSTTATLLDIGSNTYTGTLTEVRKDVNNAVLVFDFLNMTSTAFQMTGSVQTEQPWSGYDEGEAICPKFFVKGEYQGEERLFFVGFDGFLNLYEEDAYDYTEDASEAGGLAASPIVTTFRDRMLAGKEDGPKRAQELTMRLETWWPKSSVTAIYGSGARQKIFTDQTRSRKKYIRPFDRKQYDASNVNGDHEEAEREDYSVDPELLATTGIYFDAGTPGIDLNRMAPFGFKKRLRRMTNGVQIEVVNRQGRIRILQASVKTVIGTGRTGVN